MEQRRTAVIYARKNSPTRLAFMDTLRYIQVHLVLCSDSIFLSLNSNLSFEFTGEKRYKCEICGKAFTESSTRRKHMLVHNPNKQFKCEMCDKVKICYFFTPPSTKKQNSFIQLQFLIFPTKRLLVAKSI